MRRSWLAALAVLLAAAVPAQAKFGMSKTRITLHRSRPPEVPLLGETVAVEVTATTRRVSDSQLARIRGRVEEALRGWKLFSVLDGPRGAETVVRVSVEDLEARIRETVEYEEKYVKIGEHQEWNEKKKKYETKSDWGNRREPVDVTVATGSISTRVEVDTPQGPHHADASASYNEQYKGSGKAPAEARSEEALEQYLVEEAGARAAAVVSFSPDPVEALLAVDGELKPGNRLAEAGLFQQALAEWNKRTLKGDKEAARLHNVGVAHEGMAYALPPDAPEHRAELEQASEYYRKSLALDPGEKYFTDPIHRVETSLAYAARATAFQTERERFFAEAKGRPHREARQPAPGAPPKVPAATATGAPLRNGSFESDLASWTLTGKGSVVREAGRGMVLEVASSERSGAVVGQKVDVDVSGAQASLSLAYRVTDGEGRLRVHVLYGDSAGRERTSTLEVTGGEMPGEWSEWSSDLAGLRPRPSRVREIRVAVDGGVVRLDNVALTVR